MDDNRFEQDWPVEPDYESSSRKRKDPWDPYVYETGSTKPPKDWGKVVAVILSICIVVVGLVGTLKMLDIQPAVRANTKEYSTSASFTLQDDHQEVLDTSPTEEETVTPTASTETISLTIHDSAEGTANVMQEGGMSLQDIYEKVRPSVVSISCETASGSVSGTGVIMSSDGYIITNCHVVESAKTITVLLADDREFTAQSIGQDAIADLAVLWVNASDLEAAEFGDSDQLRVGDSVVAIGDPLGVELRGTMTNGIISAINRDITTGGRTMTLIQTNAALNSGNSGGPLINCYGQVIGINTLKIGDYVSSAGVEGLGFAIPVATVKDVVDQLITKGYVSGRPSLGISGDSIPSYYQYYYRVPSGLCVTEVAQDSDAYQKGIESGDVILYVDGERISSEDDLQEVVYAHQVGDTVTVILYRSGKEYQVDLTIGEYVPSE